MGTKNQHIGEGERGGSVSGGRADQVGRGKKKQPGCKDEESALCRPGAAAGL